MLGWPLLVYFCKACGHNTSVDYSATVWSQEHKCNQCGLSSHGADIAGKDSSTMNVSQHDELAQLFAQNMHLSQQAPVVVQPQPQPLPIVEPIRRRSDIKDTATLPIHFISMHYTPTAHIRTETQSEPSRSPPPPYHEALMPEAMAETLRQHSINPAALLPNQIDLFANADYEQRLRLLELWRISPPSYPTEEQFHHLHHTTSMQQEEQAAMIRYEQAMQDRSMQNPEPITPIREAGEDAWPPAARMRAASIAAATAPHYTMKSEPAEPYIMDVYHNQRNIDPVYAAAEGLWQAPHYARPVEDQYGMYEQLRNHADWERMNERMMRENVARCDQDDDMVY